MAKDGMETYARLRQFQVQRANRSTPAVATTRREKNPTLALQCTLGNQGVQRLLREGVVQAKLHVSESNDPYEQEVDRIADQVMRMPAPDASRQAPCAGCASGASPCPKCLARKEQPLQRKGAGPAPHAAGPSGPADLLQTLGSGRPLDSATRAFFEPRFGYDFGEVRVHADSRSTESARAVNALAYTVGRDVVFGAGQYSPGTSQGRQVLAHELTHVVQQGTNQSSHSPLSGLISRAPEPRIQRRVRFFVCNSTDQAQVDAAHGLPMSASVATLRAAAGTASDTAAAWANNAVALLRVSPRSGAIRSAFHDAYAQFPEWVPPWFATLGARWVDFGDLVAQRLQRVAEILAGGWIQYYCWGSPARCPECTDSPPAYDACSSFLGSYLICLGPGFWRLWAAGNTDHMALILLHEALHIYFGTTVAHTGRSGNAFCYERFIAEANGRPIQPGDAAACPTAP